MEPSHFSKTQLEALSAMEDKAPPVALVVGATGVAGSALIDYLSSLPKWRVIALALDIDPKKFPENGVTPVQADLFKRGELQEKLRDHAITHVFYTAQYQKLPDRRAAVNVQALRWQLHLGQRLIPSLLRLAPGLKQRYYRNIAKAAGLYDPEKKNLAMLENVVEALRAEKHPLSHLSLLTGGRYYGMHMGPGLYPDWKIPFLESDERHPGPNWYYDLEDYLKPQRDFTWSVVRPTFLIGFAPGAPQSFGLALAVYASVLKARGLPLIFPGSPQSYSCLWECTCTQQLARMLHWSAVTATAQGKAFNCTNGDIFAWRDVWPKIAAHFDMEVLLPRHGASAQNLLREGPAIWEGLVQKYELTAYPFEQLINPRFLDESMLINWDVIYSMGRARSLGFHRYQDTGEMFIHLFKSLENDLVIPPATE